MRKHGFTLPSILTFVKYNQIIMFNNTSLISGKGLEDQYESSRGAVMPSTVVLTVTVCSPFWACRLPSQMRVSTSPGHSWNYHLITVLDKHNELVGEAHVGLRWRLISKSAGPKQTTHDGKLTVKVCVACLPFLMFMHMPLFASQYVWTINTQTYLGEISY